MSKSTDVMYGRRGGGWLHPDHVVEDLVEPVLATCPHGDLQRVAPSAIGQPCWADGKPLKRVSKAEWWEAEMAHCADHCERCGHRRHAGAQCPTIQPHLLKDSTDRGRDA